MIQLKKNENCCGCNACAQRCPKQCITMKEDIEGFLYPTINKEICINCGLCELVCPVINQNDEREPLAVYATKNKNDEIRMQSSSGGIFTLLAERTLDRGGVVFGARFNNEWEVIHDYTEAYKGLAAFRGSKYVQSKIGETYCQAEQFLKAGRQVLFSGTPCQISGLKLFLRKEYVNLLAVDFACHGVPSPMVWRKYLQRLSRKHKRTVASIHRISFRDKNKGWKRYQIVIDYQDKVYRKLALDDLYIHGFLRNLYLRPSCHECPCKCGKSGSDIMIGDFWGIGKVLPEFDDDKGVSILLFMTDKEQGLLKKTDAIVSNYADAIKANCAIVSSATAPKKRIFMIDQSLHKEITRNVYRLGKEPLHWLFLLAYRTITQLGLLPTIKSILKR